MSSNPKPQLFSKRWQKKNTGRPNFVKYTVNYYSYYYIKYTIAAAAPVGVSYDAWASWVLVCFVSYNYAILQIPAYKQNSQNKYAAKEHSFMSFYKLKEVQ